MQVENSEYWRMTGSGSDKCAVAQYPSLGEALRAVTAQMTEDGELSRAEAFDSLESRNFGWIGRDMPDGINERMQLVYQEWEEATREFVVPCIERLRGTVIEIESVARQQQWMDQADEVDYDRMRWSGRPDFWRGAKRVAKIHSRAVTLACPVSYYASTPTQTISYHAAALATLIDLMEGAGYRVRLSFVYTGKPAVATIRPGWTPPKRVLIEFPVKDTNESLSIPAVVNVFSPWFFRQQTFAICDCGPFYTVGGAIGYPVRFRENADSSELFPGQSVVVLNAPNGPVKWELDDAVAWTRRAIEKIEEAEHAPLT